MTLLIDYRYLKGMAVLASTDPSRLVINGVLAKVRGAGENNCRLVATDGRRIGILLCTVEAEQDGDYILPIPSFSKLAPFSVGRDKNPQLFVTIADRWVTYGSKSGMSQRIKAIEGNFPNFTQIIPDGKLTAIQTFSVNTDLLRGFTEACTIISGRKVNSVQVLAHGDKEPISVFTDISEFYGLIMPVRFEQQAIPDWARADWPVKPKPEEVPVPVAETLTDPPAAPPETPAAPVAAPETPVEKTV